MKLVIEFVDSEGNFKSLCCYVIEDGVVYTAPIHGFDKEKVGEVDEFGDIKIVLKEYK